MFLVFNKEKIYSYIIAVTTVVILFGVSIMYKDNNSVEVSTNIVNEAVTENNEISNKMKNNI